MWTFGRKIAAGFAVAIVLLAAIGAVAYRSIESLTKTSYAVAHSHDVLEHIEDDRAELRAVADRLVDGGKLAVFVPAIQAMFRQINLALARENPDGD